MVQVDGRMGAFGMGGEAITVDVEVCADAEAVAAAQRHASHTRPERPWLRTLCMKGSPIEVFESRVCCSRRQRLVFIDLDVLVLLGFFDGLLSGFH